MKKHKFKFESILKLKKSKEDILKNQLGELEKKRQEILSDIEKTNKGIDQYYSDQERALSSATGREAQAYPEYIWGNFGKRKGLEKKVEELMVKIEDKRKELALARGDVKVFENLKEEGRIKHLEVSKRKEQEAQEDLYNIRKAYTGN